MRRRPVVFREGEPPLVTLFAMMRASDLPAAMRDRTWVEPPLVIRTAAGAVHPEYAAVKLPSDFRREESAKCRIHKSEAGTA